MKLYYAKRDTKCSHCKSIIFRGEIILLNVCQNKGTQTFSSFPNHPECYVEYVRKKVEEKTQELMGTVLSPPKLGRPKVYVNGKLIDRKKALLRYHRKAGNMERAEAVEGELTQLLLTNRL
jgi:predicted  nucleic acid-binding Zn-ribbon protein